MTLPACWCLWSSREVSHWAPSVLCLQRVANDAWPLIADQLRRRGYEGQLLMDQRDIRYTAKHTMPSRRLMCAEAMVLQWKP